MGARKQGARASRTNTDAPPAAFAPGAPPAAFGFAPIAPGDASVLPQQKKKEKAEIASAVPTCRLLHNADVLEAVAEYACATVKGACALRRASQGYRRAVDTTVRRLVYENQPQLRADHAATLHIHHGTEHLDAVRIAFTCDAFKNIARLVAVAFALDGSKDEHHENAECGPRPVACCDEPNDERLGDEALLGTWTGLAPKTAFAVPAPAALLRNATELYVTSAALTEGLCAAVEAAAAAAGGCRIVRLGTDVKATATSAPLLARLINALSGRLTHLLLFHATAALCSAIAKCGKLTHFAVNSVELTSTIEAKPVVDALIASQAPLTTIAAGLPADDALRLLEAVPTIVAVQDHEDLELNADALPTAVAQRMTTFGGHHAGPSLPNVSSAEVVEPGFSSESLLFLSIIDMLPVPSTDFAALFPSLKALKMNVVVDNIDFEPMTLPPSVERVEISAGLPAAVTRLCERLADLGADKLPNLREVSITAAQCAEIDISPLVAFASTLKCVAVAPGTRPTPIAPGGAISPSFERWTGQVEATLAQLVGLETALVPELPTARCLLAGHHTRLRDLIVNQFDAAGAPFTALVKACPRLVHGSYPGCTRFRAPPGWTLRQRDGHITVQRVPFNG